MSTCLEGKWDPPPSICIPDDQGEINLQELPVNVDLCFEIAFQKMVSS